MKVIPLLAIGGLLFSFPCNSHAQVKWEFSSIKKKGFLCKNIYILQLKATIADGWRIFSQDAPPENPAHSKTNIILNTNNAISFSSPDRSADPPSLASNPRMPMIQSRSQQNIKNTAIPGVSYFKENGKGKIKVYKDGLRDFFYTSEIIFEKKIRLKKRYTETVVTGLIEATVARTTTNKYVDKSAEDFYTDKVPFDISINRSLSSVKTTVSTEKTFP